MKSLYFMALIALLLTGCMPADPEARLYKIVQRKSGQDYTIFNYPSILLTTDEQQIRAQKQAESVRNFVKVGITEQELGDIWGRPNDIKKSSYPGSSFDTFIYESTGGRYNPIEHYYFIFRDKRLESWHRM